MYQYFIAQNWSKTQTNRWMSARNQREGMSTSHWIEYSCDAFRYWQLHECLVNLIQLAVNQSLLSSVYRLNLPSCW